MTAPVAARAAAPAAATGWSLGGRPAVGRCGDEARNEARRRPQQPHPNRSRSRSGEPVAEGGPPAPATTAAPAASGGSRPPRPVGAEQHPPPQRRRRRASGDPTGSHHRRGLHRPVAC